MVGSDEVSGIYVCAEVGDGFQIELFQMIGVAGFGLNPLTPKTEYGNINRLLYFICERVCKLITLMQEAYSLMQGQPDSNLQVIVDMLRMMKEQSAERTLVISSAANRPYRLGILKNQVKMPREFYDHFDDDNGEIWASFNEDAL